MNEFWSRNGRSSFFINFCPTLFKKIITCSCTFLLYYSPVFFSGLKYFSSLIKKGCCLLLTCKGKREKKLYLSDIPYHLSSPLSYVCSSLENFIPLICPLSLMYGDRLCSVAPWNTVRIFERFFRFYVHVIAIRIKFNSIDFERRPSLEFV